MSNSNQSDSAEWDVDDYFDSTLPPDHWALKKAFIEKHKHTFEKYRLLALASTFINMEFMGARYVPQVEQQIGILTSEVPEIISYRRGRRDHLKRTFVSATDATRSKLRRTDLELPKKQKPVNFVSQVHKDELTPQNSFQSNFSNTGVIPTKSRLPFFVKNLPEENIELLEKVYYQEGIRGKIILTINQNASNNFYVVQEAVTKIGQVATLTKTGKLDEKAQQEFVLTIANEEIARGFASNEKKAKETLGQIAIRTLQETCFTIVVKNRLAGNSIDKNQIKDTQKKQEDSQALSADNKGAKMMRLMGWTGQGLGKNQDGISKPIEATRNISRMGLRLDQNNDIKAIKQVIGKVLEDYIQDEEFYNLVFSAEYTNEERKIIHEVAQKLQLKSKSYGKNDQRRLTVSKKMSPYEMVVTLLSIGGENDTYKLLLPTKVT